MLQVVRLRLLVTSKAVLFLANFPIDAGVGIAFTMAIFVGLLNLVDRRVFLVALRCN